LLHFASIFYSVWQEVLKFIIWRRIAFFAWICRQILRKTSPEINGGGPMALSLSLLPLICPEFEHFWLEFERVLSARWRNSYYYFAPGTASVLTSLPSFFKPQHNLV